MIYFELIAFILNDCVVCSLVFEHHDAMSCAATFYDKRMLDI